MFETDEVKVGKFTVSVIKDDLYIGGCLRRGQEWDGWMRQDLPHIYKKGTDILDIGANIGWNSLMFSDYGPVHSFEPIFHEVVSKNISQNVLKNLVILHPYGLSSEKTKTDMFLPNIEYGKCNYGGSTLHPHNHQSNAISVDLKKLDDVYTGIPSVIKIDVEGHELDVLKGGMNVIERHKPSIYIEIFDFENSEITKLLHELGYSKIYQRPEHNYLFISPLLLDAREA
jgi:FkbM family methyltransferase